MYLGDMITEVSNIIDDDSFTDAMIITYINQAVQFAAAQVDLPDLKRFVTATTVLSQPYTTLTTVSGGFSGKILRVGDPDIAIYPNLNLLMDDYVTDTYQDLTEEGDLKAVALEGRTLWYQYVPAALTDIVLLVYQSPSALADNDDEPTDFPGHIHRPLFVNGTAWIIFDQIEDGLEGEKVNTTAHFNQSFNEQNRHSGIVKLREWLGRNRNHYKSSIWRY